MKNPLVSVVVITYNSSDCILKGLESVKSQTYDNTELIISDDCSTDNTLEVCEQWLKENSSYFKRVKLVTTLKNTGVAGNINRGVLEAQGEWIKLLSGDDQFFPNTITEYVNFIHNHPNFSVVEAMMDIYGVNKEKVKQRQLVYDGIYSQLRRKKNQYKRCLINCFFPGPTIFFKKEIFKEIGGYDERYQFCEEYPFSLYVLKKIPYIPLIEKKLVRYCVSDSSISHSNEPNLRLLKDNINFFRNYRSKELLKRYMFLSWLDLASTYYRQESVHLYPTSKSKRILSFIFCLLSPLTIHRSVTSKIKAIIN